MRPSHLLAAAEEKRVIPAALAELAAGLDEVAVPVIIVAGDQDTHAFGVTARLEQDLPNSRVEIVAGANHYLWFSKPEAVVGAIDQLSDWLHDF